MGRNHIAEEYDAKFRRWTSEDGLTMIRGLRRDGYTVADVAKKMGVSQQTLARWRKESEELSQALSEGKQLIDYRVEDALIKAALGYRTKEVTVTEIFRYGKLVERQKMVVDKDMAPNVYAIQTYLFNRLPDKWKRNRDQILETEDVEGGIQITVTRAGGESANQREEAKILPEPGSDDEDALNDEIMVEMRPDGKTNEEFEEELVYGSDEEVWDEG